MFCIVIFGAQERAICSRTIHQKFSPELNDILSPSTEYRQMKTEDTPRPGVSGSNTSNSYLETFSLLRSAESVMLCLASWFE